MKPGPTIIKRCSECSFLIEESTIRSGNTSGATFWTDGKRDFPMLPEQPWIVKCPHCHAAVWIDEQEEIGEIEAFSDDEKYKDAKSYNTLKLKDYFIVLKQGNHNRQKEQYLRIHAWWAGNDKRRDVNNANQDLSDEEKFNLDSLYKMLDLSIENDRIMMAEIKRELGKFDDAEAIIKELYSNELEQAVSIIKGLIERKISCVAEMKFGN